MKLVPAAIAMPVAKKAFLLQKSSPGILFGVGIAGVVTSTVLACRATLKVDEVLEEAKQRRLLMDTAAEENEDYKENHHSNDLSLFYIKTTMEIVKLYAPAIIIGSLSIAALTQSHRVLTRRNAALGAAYAALEKGFDEYRARVIEKYGEDQDRDFRYGTEQVQIVDEKTNRKKTVTRVGPGEPSVYAKFFDQFSTQWSRDPEVNLLTLKCHQNYANDLLRARGHVFLNEVYDMLGIPRTKAGSVVGWLLSKDGSTDDYISFGVFEGQTENARDFVNGREGSVLLDFNVDGLIYDKFEPVVEELSWQLSH